MTRITCPHCQREGTSKAVVPVGTNVRCPGCKRKFRYDGTSGAVAPFAPPAHLHVNPLASGGPDPGYVVLDTDPDPDLSPDLSPDLDFSRLDILMEEEDHPAPVSVPSGPTASVSVPTSPGQAPAAAPTPLAPLEVIVVGRRGPQAPGEPFFYVGIEIIAILDIIAGVILIGMGITGTLLSTSDNSTESSGYSGLAIVSLFCGALGALSSGMFLLLIVDVARNIRAQRYKT